MPQLPNLTCTDPYEQQNTFRCWYDKGIGNVWDFMAEAIPPLASGEFFQLTLTQVNPQTVQSTAMDGHNQPEYSAKGLPDELLLLAKATLNREVISSPKNGPAGTWRVPNATKVWERLLDRKPPRATYDAVTDIYKVI